MIALLNNLGGFLVIHWVCFIGSVGMFVVHKLTYKKYNLKTMYTFLFTWVALFANLAGAKLGAFIYNHAVSLRFGLGESGFSLYGAVVFTPIILILFAKLTKHEWKDLLDLYTPGGMLFLASAKFNCLFTRCCNGFVWEHGLKSIWTGKTHFPIQIFEGVTILLIVVTALLYKFKKNAKPGTLYPLSMIAYSCTRFIWEFFRYYTYPDERHLILGMSFWQFVSILVFIGGIIWFTVLNPDWLTEIQFRFSKLKRKKKKNIQHKKRKK